MFSLQRFFRDDRGNVAVIFGFAIVVLAAVAGVAIDYAIAVDRKRSMDAAVDAALLAAVNTVGDKLKEDQSDWATAGEEVANKMFAVNLPPQTNYRAVSFKPTIVMTRGKVTATAEYQGASETSFMKLFRINEVNFTGKSQATLGIPSYVDIHFVIDNSSSMGIGASEADQQIMYGISKCAFACHQGFGVNDVSFRPERMKNAGATIRIDLIRQAILKAIDKIEERKPENGNVRIALYTLSEFLTVLSPLESDLSKIKTSARSIGLTTGNNGGSYLSKGLEDVDARLGQGGTGEGPNNRLSFVVFMSDGVDDTGTSRYNGNRAVLLNTKLPGWRETRPSGQPAGAGTTWLQAFSPASCTSMKAKGHKVLAVQIKYIAAVGFNDNFAVDGKKVNYIRDVLRNPLVKAFQDCGVDGYREAADSAAIEPALMRIVDEIIVAQTARLSH